ncbi:MAG: 2-hydroxyacid dehydrogenase [Bacillota bacterium]
MLKKVYVTRVIPEEGLKLLRDYAEVRVWEGELPPPREVLLSEIADVDGVVSLLTDKFDEEAFSRAPKLKVVSNYAVGYDNIDIAAATRRGIMVTNTPGVLTETTADLAFALMLAAARRIVEAADYVKAGKWKTWGPTLLLGQDIHGAVLGLVGMGRIGQAVATRAKGFEMQVLYYDLVRNPEAERNLGVRYVEFEELLREADFVSIHVPLTERTRKMFDSRAFSLMKPNAVLVNTARGPIIDEQALYEALINRKLWAAALDVTDPEPPMPNNPLLTLPNVVVVPHIGSASLRTRAKMATMAAKNLIDALEGRVPENLVNPEVIRTRA